MSLTVAPSTNAEHENGVEEAERYKGCVEAGGWGLTFSVLSITVGGRCSPVQGVEVATATEDYSCLPPSPQCRSVSLFGWLVADGWCWFVLREDYCWASSLLLTLSRVGRK
jgi:hypothetical protein